MFSFLSRHLRLSESRCVRGYNSQSRDRVVFSGIQPTGIPHTQLGNYFGALQNWKKLQDNASDDDHLIFSIVGWHALTLPQNPKELLQSKRDMLATLLAIGLDPNKSVIFFQEDNPDHMELAWILNCLTPLGKLRRMTTWKSRLAASRNSNSEAEVDESMLNTGLFTYPVLQAADILAYKATHVPVGEDQRQHLELCRDLADVFNRTFSSSLFALPHYIDTPFKRILSLRDPSSKMSKSAADATSRILLTDTFPEIKAKLRSAVTDSLLGITYDPVNRPGTSNLLNILAGCTGEEVHIIAARYSDKGHGALKRDAGEAIEEMLKGPRTEFLRIRDDKEHLSSIAEQGAEKARVLSKETLSQVRRLVGLSS